MFYTILIACLVPLLVYAAIDIFAGNLPEDMYQFIRYSKTGQRISWSVSMAIYFIGWTYIAGVFTGNPFLRLAIGFTIVAVYFSLCYWLLNVYAKPKPGDRGYKP